MELTPRVIPCCIVRILEEWRPNSLMKYFYFSFGSGLFYLLMARFFVGLTSKGVQISKVQKGNKNISKMNQGLFRKYILCIKLIFVLTIWQKYQLNCSVTRMLWNGPWLLLTCSAMLGGSDHGRQVYYWKITENIQLCI